MVFQTIAVQAPIILWTYCTEVLLLAKAFNLNQFILLGHSMGGGIANLVAGLAPDHVAKLVLLDVLGVITTGSENTLEQMRKGLSQRVDKALRKPVCAPLEKAIAARAKNGITLEAAALLGARASQIMSQDFIGNMTSV